MELATVSILDLITNVGFPIACVVVMAWFIYKIYKSTTDRNATDMKAVQDRCREREEKLYEQLAANREINAKAIETIAHYAEKLEVIQVDINEIKTDITILTTKLQ